MRIAAAALAAAALLAGCSSRGYESSGDVAAAMNNSIASVEAFSAKRETAFEALNALLAEPAAGLPARFESLSAAVDGVAAAEKSMESAIADMKSAAEARFSDWKAGEAAYTDASIKARSEMRRAQAEEVFRKAVASIGAMHQQAKGFVTYLSDLRMLLSNDLTPAAVRSSEDLARNAKASNGRLHSLTQPTVADLRAAAEALSTK